MGIKADNREFPKSSALLLALCRNICAVLHLAEWPADHVSKEAFTELVPMSPGE